jgi:hypothetical protein
LVTEIKYPGGQTNRFWYDAMLRRCAMEDSSGLSYFTWDQNGMNLLAERDASGGTIAYYTHGYSVVNGIGTLVAAKREEAGASYYQYPVYDHRGTVMRLVDENGTPTAYYEYDAWGNELHDDVVGGTGTNRFRYQSNWIELTDSDGELYLSPTRVYHAGTGRFLGRDLVSSLSGGQGFVLETPPNLVDPNGARPKPSNYVQPPIPRPPEPPLPPEPLPQQPRLADLLYGELLAKITRLCCDCIPVQHGLDIETLSRCYEEATQIANAYRAVWKRWANSPSSWGAYWQGQFRKEMARARARGDRAEVKRLASLLSSDQYNWGQVRAGWICSQWRAFTYRALSRLQLRIFHIGIYGQFTMAAEGGGYKAATQHNWVTITVGNGPRGSGSCTLHLDPWKQPSGPNAYTDAEHMPWVANFQARASLGAPGEYEARWGFVRTILPGRRILDRPARYIGEQGFFWWGGAVGQRWERLTEEWPKPPPPATER